MNKNSIPPDAPMFPISALAQHLEVHQRTLRIYDHEKILSPQRSPKNTRLYSLNDMKKAEFIQYLTQNLRLNLAGVKPTLELLKKLNVPFGDYRDVLDEIASIYDMAT